jgi:glycosyltransferase involved in cell wall biosynthesis
MDWRAQTTNRLFSTGSGARASAALKRGGFAGAVAIGSGYSTRSSTPTVTYDDMTVVQALEQLGSEYDSVSKRAARRWRERQRRGYEAARACCVASEWTAKSVIEDYEIDPEKVRVIGFGRNAPEQVVDRDWQQPGFLFVGFDWERKRGPAVLEAFSHVLDRNPGATLDLVGGHPPMDLPGVSGHGPLSLANPEDREEMSTLLARATCFVMPSTFEPFGIAYIDAAASGVASIGTTNGGAASAIGEGGLLVDPDDDDALMDAMLSMCDPETAKRLGDRAFSHSQGFTWERVANRVVDALDIE